jgi:hypothetical protein
MLGSGGDALERQIRKLHKERELEPAVKMVRLRKLFCESASSVPSALLEELFLQLQEEPSQTGEASDRFLDLLYASADLFHHDYDDKEDLFSRNEWRLISELVSAYGEEIDDDTLTYVMSRVVDHSAL